VNLPPITPTDAPQWFVRYGSDNEAVIRTLLAEIAALKKRLAAAGIA
jgi:hypothetical protein